MSRTYHGLVVVLVFLVGVLGAVVRAQQPDEFQAQQPDEFQTLAAGPEPQAVSRCTGTTVKAVRAVMQTEPTTIGEGGFVALPGATVSFTVPAGTLDTFVVTFSGECRLSGASPDDWVEVEVRLDGVALPPGGSPSPMAFCSADSWAMHSATFCQRVGEGPHTVQVFWKLVDSAPDGTLSGWLDDW